MPTIEEHMGNMDDANGAAGTKRKYGSDDDEYRRFLAASKAGALAASIAPSSGDGCPASSKAAKTKRRPKSPRKHRKTAQKNFSKLGRRGDPRMHKSVAARLVNADMPLLRALLTGGFVFPILSAEGMPLDPRLTRVDDAKVLDADGVTLAQRKNQLSRRIRIAREKIRDECGGDMSEYTDVLTEDTPAASVGAAGVADVPASSHQGKKVPQGRRASIKSEAKLKAMLGSSEARKQADILIRERPDAMDFSAKVDDEGEGGAQAEGADVGAVLSNGQAEYSYLPTTDHEQPLSVAVAGLMDAAPEVLYEDPDADPPGAGWSYRSRTAKDHPMFAQYQASITGGTAGLAALGAVASAHAATTSDAAATEGDNGGGAMTDSLSLAAASMGISPEMISMMIRQGSKQSSASSASEQKKNEEDRNIEEGDEAGDDDSTVAVENAKKSAGEDAGSAASPEVDSEQEAAMDEAKMKIAINVYQTEHSTLLKRCLMIAGFDPSRSEECDPLYIQFAERCAQAEHRRLHRLTLCFQGRHVHRLDGKCGHKAVLHHPAGDDRPHVDFIVNGKVECFRNASGIKSADGNEALWPSKFSCDDAGCGDHTTCNHPDDKNENDCHKKSHADVTCGMGGKCDHKCSEAAKKMGNPSILYLSEQDIAGHDEWRCMSEIDVGSVLDGLLDDSTLGMGTLAADPRSRSNTMTDDRKPSGKLAKSDDISGKI